MWKKLIGIEIAASLILTQLPASAKTNRTVLKGNGLGVKWSKCRQL